MKNIFKSYILCISFLTIHTSGNTQIQDPLTVASESDIDIKDYTGIISERYSNGRPSLWKTLVNGKTEGLWLEWYPNGTLRYRANWKNSLGSGKWEYFYPNGVLRSVSFYIKDIAQGLFRNYYKNGQLKTDATYLNGKKDGIEIVYDINGLPLFQRRYENGKQVIDEPIIFQPGNISVENGNEWGISFMPDGNTAYFTRRDLDTGKKRIYITSKTETGWNEPLIANFSTDEDEGVFVNKKGNKLFFASYKPLSNGSFQHEMDMNIWVMERINQRWSDPQPLSRLINKSMKKDNLWPANYEAGPTTDAKGNLYYWTKGTESNSTNLYFSGLKTDGSYGEPIELMPPSSTINYDTSPHLSPDGEIIFFGSDNRNDGYGNSDIYYSTQTQNGWSKPKNLGPIVNSSYSEGSPSFSPDGKYFYFSSNRGDLKDANGENIWNIYFMESRFLMIKK